MSVVGRVHGHAARCLPSNNSAPRRLRSGPRGRGDHADRRATPRCNRHHALVRDRFLVEGRVHIHVGSAELYVASRLAPSVARRRAVACHGHNPDPPLALQVRGAVHDGELRRPDDPRRGHHQFPADGHAGIAALRRYLQSLRPCLSGGGVAVGPLPRRPARGFGGLRRVPRGADWALVRRADGYRRQVAGRKLRLEIRTLGVGRPDRLLHARNHRVRRDGHRASQDDGRRDVSSAAPRAAYRHDSRRVRASTCARCPE